MSTTPTKGSNDNLHGEQDASPRFGVNENPQGVYDDSSKPASNIPSDPSAASSGALSGSDLASKEKQPGSSADPSSSEEASKLGLGNKNAENFGYRQEKGSIITRIRGRFSRRSIIGIAAAGVLGLSGIGIFSVV